MNHFKVLRETMGFSGIFLITYIDCGYDASTYSAIEIGKARPSPFLINELCSTYHVDPKWFEGETEKILRDMARVRPTKEKIIKRFEEIKSTRSVTYDSLLSDAGLDRAILYHKSNISISSIEKIAQAAYVGFEWLLWGEENAKECPMNEKLEHSLRKHEDIRRDIWSKMGTMPLLTDGVSGVDLFSRIESIRQALCLNKNDFAETVGVNPKHLWLSKNRKIRLHLSTIYRIADKIGIGRDWLNNGLTENQYYPCDRLMKNWLKEHPSVRRDLYCDLK